MQCCSLSRTFPASILYKSIAGRLRPVRVVDRLITARYRFKKNAYWELPSSYMINVLKFQTPKCLIKWQTQTVQTQIRLFQRSSLIRVYTVCHSTKLSAAGGCELSTTTRVKTAWKKFKDLLPVLSSRHLSFKTCGRVYSSCVRSAMLHASEIWPLTKPNLQRLQLNDRAMIRQICNVRPQDIVTTRSSELLVRLGIEDLDLILKERRLRWYGHVERSNGGVKTAFDIQVDGKCGPGKPKMTWKLLTEGDCKEWKLSAINPHDRCTWRSGVRSAMHAASQLSGRGITDVHVAPVPAC